MPTYEYVCNACRHEFEAFQSIKADPLTTCPECRGPVRRKIGTGGGVIFRGAGFYATDYRSSDYRQKAKSESKGPSGGSGDKKGDSPGSTSKPAESSSSAEGGKT
jgi:putative FmdB family regulatory protein